VPDEDPREPGAPYLRVAADLRRRIESGELPPGAALPSINRLSQETGYSKNTIVRAYAVLKRAGLIRTEAGWGTFVAEKK
jgi:DNA-binding GntR family transcriptional regulator